MSQPVLQIIVGSTRPIRSGGIVADWFLGQAKECGHFDVKMTDLRELDLPLMNEPKHPSLQQYQYEHTKKWAGIVEEADVFVFVIPEYNFSYPASVKNALDYLVKEWANKAAGTVSYGGISGGLRASNDLKSVANALSIYMAPEFVMLPNVYERIQGETLIADKDLNESAQTLLKYLAELDQDLRPRRIRRHH